jgi:predicted dehydrogenase
MYTQTATDPIRVGIAGLGRSGWNLHVNALADMPEQYRVVAVSDPNVERQQEARTRLGCRAYPDLAGLLADGAVELVVLATPSHLHPAEAIAAMQAGKDVLVEKPFAPSLAEADSMLAVAQSTGRVLSGSQNSRYAADFLKVREVLDSGKLGRILQVRINWHSFRRRWDWQTLKEFGGGSLNNDGSHAIDQALLLLGDAAPRVFCHMECTPLSSGDAEDHVKVLLHAPGAPLIDLEFSNACAYPQEPWLVLGTSGGLAGTHSRLRWRYVDAAKLPARPVDREPTPDRTYNREELPWVEESADLAGEAPRASNKRLYADLYATLRQGAPLAITPQSIRRQIAVLEQCRALSPV